MTDQTSFKNVSFNMYFKETADKVTTDNWKKLIVKNHQKAEDAGGDDYIDEMREQIGNKLYAEYLKDNDEFSGSKVDYIHTSAELTEMLDYMTLIDMHVIEDEEDGCVIELTVNFDKSKLN